MFKKILPLFIVVVLIGGCEKKYPDDNRRYTKTPTERLTCHDWHLYSIESLISSQYVQNSLLTLGEDRYPISFNTENICTGGTSNPFVSPSPTYLFNFYGSWEFIENNDKIKVKNMDGHVNIWTIHALTKNGLTISNDSIKYVFTKKRQEN
ncbi:hypothetical protein BH10BAC1_BH10BAC1_01840 [soil metagenome]